MGFNYSDILRIKKDDILPSVGGFAKDTYVEGAKEMGKGIGNFFTTNPYMSPVTCMTTMGLVGCGQNEQPEQQYVDPNAGQQEQMIMIVILVIIGIFILVIISSLFGQSSEDKMMEMMMMEEMMEDM